MTGTSENEVELKIRSSVTPLIETGKQIHTDMIKQLNNTYEWQQLTQDEKTMILNFDDKQMSELALFFTQEENIALEGSSTVARKVDTQSEIIGCALTALGLKEAYDIYQTTREFNKIMSTGNSIKLLKKIGSRFLGWVGLAWAVIEFIDCITD